VNRRVVHVGKIFSVVEEERRLGTGEVLTLEYVEAPDVVRVYPVQNRSIWLIKEFRHELQCDVLRTVGGRIDGDEGPVNAALRELREEIGAIGRDPIVFATSQPILKVRSIVHHVLVNVDEFVRPSPEVGEVIHATEVPLTDLENLVWQGQVVEDVIALQLLRFARHQDWLAGGVRNSGDK
jgi:ADP-ribose pyrophosphatase